MKTLKYAFQVAETAVNLSSLAQLNQQIITIAFIVCSVMFFF